VKRKERMGEGGGGRRGTSKLKEAARKVAVAAAYACGSFSRRKALVDPVSIDTSCSLSATVNSHFPFSQHYAFLSSLAVCILGKDSNFICILGCTAILLNWCPIGWPSSSIIGFGREILDLGMLFAT